MFRALYRSASSLRLTRRFHTRCLALADETDSSTSSNVTTTGFKWQQLVTPYTNPEFAARMKSLEQQLSSMRAELVGVPKEIEPIEWSEWEQKIEDIEAVNEIRKNYEQLDIKEEKGADLTELNNQLDTGISKIQASSQLVEEELSKLRSELGDAKKEKEAVPNWHFHDYLNRYPGLAEQNREQYMQGYQLPSEAEERLGEVDPNELRRLVKTGGRITIDPEAPTKIGYYDAEKELLQVQATAKKIWGDSPKWNEINAEIIRELEAIKQPKEAEHGEEHH